MIGEVRGGVPPPLGPPPPPGHLHSAPLGGADGSAPSAALPHFTPVPPPMGGGYDGRHGASAPSAARPSQLPRPPTATFVSSPLTAADESSGAQHPPPPHAERDVAGRAPSPPPPPPPSPPPPAVSDDELDSGALVVEAPFTVLNSIARLQHDRMFTDCTILTPSRVQLDDDDATSAGGAGAATAAVDAKAEKGAQDGTFRCHRAVLAAASPFWERLLRTQGNVLRLRDYPSDVMRVVLDFIYTGRTKVPHELLYAVHDAALLMALGELQRACVTRLLARMESGDDAAQLSELQRLDAAVRSGDVALVQASYAELAAAHWRPLLADCRASQLPALSDYTMRMLLRSEDLPLEEMPLYAVLLRWARRRQPQLTSLASVLGEYLPLIRYGLMSVEELEQLRAADIAPRELLLDAALAATRNPAEWDIARALLRRRSSTFLHRWRVRWADVAGRAQVWSEAFNFVYAGVEHHWRLLLYPRSRSSPKHMSLFLQMVDDEDDAERYDADGGGGDDATGGGGASAPAGAASAEGGGGTDAADGGKRAWSKTVDFDFVLRDFKKRHLVVFRKEPSVFSPHSARWGFSKFRERAMVERADSTFIDDGVVEFIIGMKMLEVKLDVL